MCFQRPCSKTYFKWYLYIHRSFRSGGNRAYRCSTPFNSHHQIYIPVAATGCGLQMTATQFVLLYRSSHCRHNHSDSQHRNAYGCLVDHHLRLSLFPSVGVLQKRFRFRKMPSTGMLRRVAVVRSDVSEERIASIIMMAIIGELRTLAVTSGISTQLSV
jgi:hypothetical protein